MCIRGRRKPNKRGHVSPTKLDHCAGASAANTNPQSAGRVTDGPLSVRPVPCTANTRTPRHPFYQEDGSCSSTSGDITSHSTRTWPWPLPPLTQSRLRRHTTSGAGPFQDAHLPTPPIPCAKDPRPGDLPQPGRTAHLVYIVSTPPAPKPPPPSCPVRLFLFNPPPPRTEQRSAGEEQD